MNLYKIINRKIGISCADTIFENCGWAGYQFGITYFQNLTEIEFKNYVEIVKQNFLKTQFENSKIIFITKDFNNYIENELKNKKFNENYCKSFIILISEQEKYIAFLANHALCDGIILYSILGIIHNFNDTLSLPKYKRIPLLSEFLLLEYSVRTFYNSLFFKPLPIVEKNRRFSIIFPLENRKRFAVYGKIFDTIYKCLDTEINSLRIAFTVAWDDDQCLAKNRIGGIIIDIPRLDTEKQYEKHIENELLRRKMDSLQSYELIKSYYVPYLRRKFCSKIHGILTSFVLPKNVNGFTKAFGGFAGNIGSPFYINSMTCTNQEPRSYIKNIYYYMFTTFFYR